MCSSRLLLRSTVAVSSKAIETMPTQHLSTSGECEVCLSCNGTKASPARLSVDSIQVGVGVNSDFRRLANDYGVKAEAGLDLAVASRKYLSSVPAGVLSLSSLCSELLKQDLPKTQAIRMSRWEAELSDKQASVSVVK